MKKIIALGIMAVILLGGLNKFLKKDTSLVKPTDAVIVDGSNKVEEIETTETTANTETSNIVTNTVTTTIKVANHEPFLADQIERQIRHNKEYRLRGHSELSRVTQQLDSEIGGRKAD